MPDGFVVTAVSAVARAVSDVGAGQESAERLVSRLEGAAEGRGEVDRGLGETIAEGEGWSAYGMMDSADEVLWVGRVDDVPLLDSQGEVATYVSEKEAAIYEDADLRTDSVNGRECLVRDDVDPHQQDPFGRSNMNRMEDGLAPLDRDGRSIELHHVQQENEGVLAELTHQEHVGSGNNEVLHDKGGPSEIDREGFASVRAEHWEARGADMRAQVDAGGESAGAEASDA